VLQLEALLRENAELRAQLTSVLAHLAQERVANAKLSEQLAKLNDRVAELLAIAQRRQRKPAAEKPPEAPPAVTGETKRAFDERPQAPAKPDEPKTPKTRAKPTGRKPLPTHLEVEAHELCTDTCAHCGSAALDAAGEVLEEKLHVVKEHQRRRVVRRNAYSAHRDHADRHRDHVGRGSVMTSPTGAIAKKTLHVDTLETRKSDSLDFHDVAVWSVKAALEAAYRAGLATAKEER